MEQIMKQAFWYFHFRVKLLAEAQKYKETSKNRAEPARLEPVGSCEHTATKIESKRANVKTMQKAIYSEMSEYIHSLKKLKNSKINELIEQYSNMNGDIDCVPIDNPSQCEI